MTSPHDIIKRLEAASGPDRELDVAIVYALFPDIGPYQGQCVGDEPIFWHEPYRKQKCPHYTASLDASIALVEKMGARLPPRVTWWTILKDALDEQGWMSAYNRQGRLPATDLPRFVLLALFRSIGEDNGGLD